MFSESFNAVFFMNSKYEFGFKIDGLDLSK